MPIVLSADPLRQWAILKRDYFFLCKLQNFERPTAKFLHAFPDFVLAAHLAGFLAAALEAGLAGFFAAALAFLAFAIEITPFHVRLYRALTILNFRLCARSP
jgi:ABC-type uncharacterized transport system permease subunit